jgi:hypothetical protein
MPLVHTSAVKGTRVIYPPLWRFRRGSASIVTNVTEKLPANEYAWQVPTPVNPRQEADVYGFHDFETAKKLAEQKTNETGKQHCVLHAADVDGPGGMFTLGVYSQRPEINGVGFINKIMRTLFNGSTAHKMP